MHGPRSDGGKRIHINHQSAKRERRGARIECAKTQASTRALRVQNGFAYYGATPDSAVRTQLSEPPGAPEPPASARGVGFEAANSGLSIGGALVAAGHLWMGLGAWLRLKPSSKSATSVSGPREHALATVLSQFNMTQLVRGPTWYPSPALPVRQRLNFHRARGFRLFFLVFQSRLGAVDAPDP